jgi:hypothetical protein
MHPDARVNARINASLAHRIAAVRRRTGKSLSEIVKESLDRYCTAEEQNTPYDALAGFVGCASGAKDLSRSYKNDLRRSLERSK